MSQTKTARKGQFRKKPVVIDAVEFTGENYEEVAAFTGQATELYKHTTSGEADGLKVRTLEGDVEARPGDMIIKGVKGEFYPCKPDIFDMTYDQGPTTE